MQNDTLYMDGSDTKVVVSGYNSQKVMFFIFLFLILIFYVIKVWVFNLEEEDSTNPTIVPEFLAKMSHLANRAK